MATRTIRVQAARAGFGAGFELRDMDIQAERVGSTERWRWTVAGSAHWFGSFETEEAAFAGAAAALGGESRSR